jgi:hypothetical protein
MQIVEVYSYGCDAFIQELGEIPFPLCLAFNSDTIKSIVMDWVRNHPDQAEKMLDTLQEIIQQYRKDNAG